MMSLFHIFDTTAVGPFHKLYISYYCSYCFAGQSVHMNHLLFTKGKAAPHNWYSPFLKY
jgi:hypothetical protein